MTQDIQKLNCANCKTNITIKTTLGDDQTDYKLICCPNCNAPIREVRSDEYCFVEGTCLDSE